MLRYARVRRRLTLAVFASIATAVRAQASNALNDADRRRLAARAMALRDEALRRGDQPYGAVVARNGVIVAEGISAVVTSGDVDAHAERLALRAAVQALGTDDLSDCVLIGSARACTLCEAAAVRVRIVRMYFGAEGTDAGPPHKRPL